MVHIGFHGFFFETVIWHMFIPFLDKEVLDFFITVGSTMNGFLGLWHRSVYWTVTVRDGPMILSSIFSVIALRYSLIRKIELSDSTLYIPVDEPLSSFIPQTSNRYEDGVVGHFGSFVVC
jgi:hypothetical protein